MSVSPDPRATPPGPRTTDVTSASGITSRAMRRALMVCWVIGTSLSVPAWAGGSVAGYLLCSAWLGVSSYLVTSREPCLGPVRAGIIAAAPTVAACTLLLPLDSPPDSQMWAWQFSGNLLGLLAARGARAAGAAGLAAQVALLTFWLAGLPSTSLFSATVELLVACLPFAVGLVWYQILRSSLRSARISDEAAELARLEADAARTATQRGLELMDLVSTRSAPLLERLAGGDPTVTGRQCLVTEASVRDLIRAPRLTVPPLADAAAHARDEGVAVTLLDDGEESLPVPPGVLAEVAALVERSARMGATRVLVRALPSGRADSMTFLADGMPEDAALRWRWSFPG